MSKFSGKEPEKKIALEERKKKKKMSIMSSSEKFYTVNSNSSASALCTSRTFHLMCLRLPFIFAVVRLDLGIKDQLLCFQFIC